VRARTISPRFTARTLLTCLSCSDDLTSLATRSNLESLPAWPNSTAKRRMPRNNVPLGTAFTPPTTNTPSSGASETPAIFFHMAAPAEPPKCESGVGVGSTIQSISSTWQAACSAPYVPAPGPTSRGPNILPTSTHGYIHNSGKLPSSSNKPLDHTTIGRFEVQPMPTSVDGLWDDEFLSIWTQSAVGVRYVESAFFRATAYCASGSETGRVKTDKRSIRSLRFRSRLHRCVGMIWCS
jgi:hypothetical protein